MDMLRLISVVTRFRDALETDEVKGAYFIFNNFPAGACMDASILLGVYLQETGFGQFSYTQSENAEGKTHSWLENDTFIVDITADQFSGIEEKVIVKIRNNTDTHLGFTVSCKSTTDLNVLVGPIFCDIVNAYERIKKHLAK